MEYPNDVVSLHKCADIIEGYWSLSPEYQELITSKLYNQSPFADKLAMIKSKYIAGDRREKIPAIKEVREASYNPVTRLFMGLKEAKDLVESW